MIEGDFDAVDLMLPHDLHENAAIAAFRANKHVLLEKPIAMSLDACERIFKEAKRRNLIFMVGENAQYWPEVVKAQELIESGAIGEVLTAYANFSWALDEKFWIENPDQWRNKKSRAGGGLVIDPFGHVWHIATHKENLSNAEIYKRFQTICEQS